MMFWVDAVVKEVDVEDMLEENQLWNTTKKGFLERQEVPNGHVSKKDSTPG